MLKVQEPVIIIGDIHGQFYDLVHIALGGAYCDLFTCDGAMDRTLGSLRSRLGLQLQVSRKGTGSDDVFVTALDLTLERLSSGSSTKRS